MDLTQWGNTHFYDGYNKAIVYKFKSKGEYHIQIKDNFTLTNFKIDDKILFSFKDTMLDVNDLSSFKREIKNQTYIFDKGELQLKKVNRKVRYISSIKPSVFLDDKIMTMDLETRNINGTLTPYCICIYDGKISSSFYLSDYHNPTEMLETSILSIMKRKYNGYKVYSHNFYYLPLKRRGEFYFKRLK